MKLYVYADESGTFDKAHNDIFVYSCEGKERAIKISDPHAIENNHRRLSTEIIHHFMKEMDYLPLHAGMLVLRQHQLEIAKHARERHVVPRRHPRTVEPFIMRAYIPEILNMIKRDSQSLLTYFDLDSMGFEIKL